MPRSSRKREMYLHLKLTIHLVHNCEHIYCMCYHACALVNRPKHPPKVHVWAGIRLRGPTKICIFWWNHGCHLLVDIIDSTLMPFMPEKYPTGHRLMQDNDPKHTSLNARCFFWKEGDKLVENTCRIPWYQPHRKYVAWTREYIKREIKPHTKEQRKSWSWVLKVGWQTNLEWCFSSVHVRWVWAQLTHGSHVDVP